ncbi:MAG: hypothetical protein SXQ77_06110 [Halobacteria archaeon]|nr:hypothetical protein [Halobacteria archaeon]
MAKKVVCDICGDEIFLEPEDTEVHRGGKPGKIGITEDGKPMHVCREHLTF